MISLYYNNVSLPILRASISDLALISPKKGKDVWEIRNDATNEVLASHDPRWSSRQH